MTTCDVLINTYLKENSSSISDFLISYINRANILKKTMAINNESINEKHEDQTKQKSKTSKYGFDINYIRRFININKILFPAFLTKTVGWILFLIIFRYNK